MTAGCLATKTDFSVNDILCFNAGARTEVIYIDLQKAAGLSFEERSWVFFHHHVVHCLYANDELCNVQPNKCHVLDIF